MPAVLGTDSWNADAFGAASALFRVSGKVSASVSSQLTLLTLAGRLWGIDHQLKELLEKFYRETSTPSNQSIRPSEERVRGALATLRTLCGHIEELYNTGKARGLTNRTLIGTSLNSIRVRGDELLDIVESVELSMEPQAFEPIFEKALEEFKRGEAHDLASIK
jgi:hypothetical protein